MKEQPINLTDFSRIFNGDLPPLFYLEIAIRAIIIYLVLIAAMRMLGSRMSSQVSRLELCTMVALASAIGVPMLNPDRGMLPVIIIAIPVVVISKLIARWSFDNERIEETVHGDTRSLVEDGVLNYPIMQNSLTTRERLQSYLRSQEICQLGSVKRLYLEANGQFTLVKEPSPKPGLSVLPDFDPEFSAKRLQSTGEDVCADCGTSPQTGVKICPHCGSDKRTHAVMEV
jgi:uncharacterized membrane protein YcaP (DUF421 family)